MTRNVQETKLTSWQGLGILSFEVQGNKDIPSGSQAYVSLLIRNNALGLKARDVIGRLENVEPFVFRNCTEGYVTSKDIYPVEGGCVNTALFNDNGKSYAEHHIRDLFNGEEMELLWLIRAPTGAETAQSIFNHKIYATLNYNYSTISTVNLIAMSQTEMTRRRQEGEKWDIKGDTTNTAGDLSIDNSMTNQPMIFQTDGTNIVSPEYYLSFKIVDKGGQGNGMTAGDINVTIYIPDGIFVDPEKVIRKDYKWDCYCSNGAHLAGDTNKRACPLSSCTLLNKQISTGEVITESLITLPFQIDSTELNDVLIASSIGEKTYTFYTQLDYQYRISADTTLKVVPI